MHMETLLLVINIILAVILVLLVLLQKSEGGALGIGVSQENFMLSRSAGSFMTKATAIVATLFIICSLALTIVSRGELTPTNSVLDTVEEKTEDLPKIAKFNHEGKNLNHKLCEVPPNLDEVPNHNYELFSYEKYFYPPCKSSVFSLFNFCYRTS